MEFLPFPSKCSEVTAIGRTALYVAVQHGLFPRPVAVNGTKKALPKHEVEAVMRARLADKGDDEVRALVESLHEARKALA